jgi:hypothetical protein
VGSADHDSGVSWRASSRLGRQIRSGPAGLAGIPTFDFLREAVAAGDLETAVHLAKYQASETRAVYFIFTRWIEELLELVASGGPANDVHLERLTTMLGPVPSPDLPERAFPDLEDDLLDSVRRGEKDVIEERIDELRQSQIEHHDRLADWCWGLLTVLQNGTAEEEEFGQLLRLSMEPWIAERYKVLEGMTMEEIFELTIEGMRGHFGGPDRAGSIDVLDLEDRWVMEFDPCGTGGRMRRGDDASEQGSREEAPYEFGSVQGAYPWTWGAEGVCSYCAHCSFVNEIIPIERLGYPMRVTEYPQNRDDRCKWTIFKDPALVPDSAYLRVGKTPPSKEKRSK